MPELIQELVRLVGGSANARYVLRLYVTGASPQSSRAIVNIRKICETRLKGRYELEVVDLYQQPNLATGQQIIVAPTLVKQRPLPARRLIGDLSQTSKVLMALDIKSDSAQVSADYPVRKAALGNKHEGTK